EKSDVAENCPDRTGAAISSSETSTMYDVPDWIARTLRSSRSIPVTRNPAFASSRASGSPTYPSPMTPQRALRRSILSINSCICVSPDGGTAAGGSLFDVPEVLQALSHLGLLVVGVALLRWSRLGWYGRFLDPVARALSHGSVSSRAGHRRQSRIPPVAPGVLSRGARDDAR